MRHVVTKILAISCVCSAFIGCDGNKEGAGTLIGAGLGGLAGAAFGQGGGQIGMIAAGALLGGVIGNRIGHHMDEQDRRLAAMNAQKALETSRSGQALAWHNPDNGHSGTMTPVKTYETSGRYCREFRQTIQVGKKSVEGYGKACRQPDGVWQIVSQNAS